MIRALSLVCVIHVPPDINMAHLWVRQPLKEPAPYNSPRSDASANRYIQAAVKTLRFTEKDEGGFWEMRGYHMYGDPWREQRFTGD